MSGHDYPIGIGDYWAILLRRKWHFLLPFAAVLGLAAGLAFLLPPTYRSEATFTIERQAIPQDLVATTVTGYVQEQLEQIRQRILTHDNLLEIAAKHGLYAEERENSPREAVEQMKENIEIEMVDVQATDPDKSGVRLATVAFNIAFSAGTAEAAQAVTQDLSRRYQAGHREARAAQAQQVSAFLGREADKLQEEISAIEASLAEFKQEELRQLPELMSMNLRLYEQTERAIEDSEEQIRSLQEQINVTRSELSLTQPYREVISEQGEVLLSAPERLSALTAEYMQMTGRYSGKHPDVIRLGREIRLLAERTGSGARADEMLSELVRVQENLRQARQNYGPEHPEVQRLERSVAAVQRGLQSAVVSSDNDQELRTPPDNPRYVALQTQLTATESNLRAEQQKLETYRSKLAEYEERLFQTPAVERDFTTLSRDYENTVQKYRDLRTKQRQAEVAQELEAGESAERFVLTSPAFLPVLPDSPNRIGILLLGMLLAGTIAMITVALAEYLDRTVRSSRAIASILGVPPLAVIPRM